MDAGFPPQESRLQAADSPGGREGQLCGRAKLLGYLNQQLHKELPDPEAKSVMLPEAPWAYGRPISRLSVWASRKKFSGSSSLTNSSL